MIFLSGTEKLTRAVGFFNKLRFLYEKRIYAVMLCLIGENPIDGDPGNAVL